MPDRWQRRAIEVWQAIQGKSGGDAAAIIGDALRKAYGEHRNGFHKPSISEVEEFIKEVGIRGVSARAFWLHYEAVGWKKGRTAISNWKAAVYGWEPGMRS